MDFKIIAEPNSVNILSKDSKRDVRTVDKLVNFINDTYDVNNMWLAPFIDPKKEKQEPEL